MRRLLFIGFLLAVTALSAFAQVTWQVKTFQCAQSFDTFNLNLYFDATGVDTVVVELVSNSPGSAQSVYDDEGTYLTPLTAFAIASGRTVRFYVVNHVPIAGPNYAVALNAATAINPTMCVLALSGGDPTMAPAFQSGNSLTNTTSIGAMTSATINFDNALVVTGLTTNRAAPANYTGIQVAGTASAVPASFAYRISPPNPSSESATWMSATAADLAMNMIVLRPGNATPPPTAVMNWIQQPTDTVTTQPFSPTLSGTISLPARTQR